MEATAKGNKKDDHLHEVFALFDNRPFQEALGLLAPHLK